MKTGNRGRPCKKYQIVPADSNVEVEPDDEAAGLVKHLDSASAEIIADPYADEWKEAILDEYAAHIVNQTWEIVDYPSSRKPIGSRFVLKTKFKENGDIERRKARLVAKGYAQRPGTDFQETFAPVARISSIRMLMALSAEWNLTVHQMDVVTAYLNGEIEEELFMEIPEQLEESLSDIMNKEHVNDRIMDTARKWLNLLQSGKQKACRIKKALYGLRQSGRQWYRKLDEKLRRIGFRPLKADPCLYSYQQEGKTTIVSVYVDDILIATNDMQEMAKIKKELKTSFKMKDLGPVHYCLGIELKQDTNGTIKMMQRKYVEDILIRFEMKDCKPINTPLDGKQERHVMEHWNAAKRVLRYLKSTSNYGLTFKKTGEDLVGYVDADWAGCPDDRRSYTGYAFIFGNATVS